MVATVGSTAGASEIGDRTGGTVRLEPVREWRLHLGAHKTATTHLQETLALRRDWLVARGVDVLPMPAVRALRLPPAAGWKAWRLRLGWPMRRAIEAAVAPLRQGPGRVAISEENLIGFPQHLMGGPFYPKAARRLAGFGALAAGGRLHVFFAVRSFERLLPSAYIQRLRHHPHPRLDGFGPIRAAALRQPPSWTELLLRLRDTLPGARFTVWRQEDYRAHDWRILSCFCGVEIPPGERLADPPRTRSPSARVVAALETLDLGLVGPARVEAARRIVDADTGDEPFDPFPEAEKRLLAEAYAADLAELERRLSGALLWF
jgi:hypothetical protein